MWFKILINSITIAALSLVQISFISSLPFPANKLNLVLAALIFSLSLSGKIKNIWFYVLAGLIFDMFFVPPVKIFILAWPLTFLFCRLLLRNVFTNRSLFSFLAICLFTDIFYIFFIKTSFYIYGFFSSGSRLFILSLDFWNDMLFRITVDFLLVLVLFYIFNFISKRLKPVFILRY
ncbi:hypothetical protein GF382_03140 [Candidatus Falkowbacteria bacterium]|nr:hypothetical protein [Candidatus Falkowbacteria bacterium]